MDAKLPDDTKATQYLANERTFLAWVRTSIAIMSLGFVVAKFGLWLRELGAQVAPKMQSYSPGMAAPIGVAMIGLGGALALLAAWRFSVVNRQIAAGRICVDRWLVALTTIAIAALALLMMAYIGVTTAPGR